MGWSQDVAGEGVGPGPAAAADLAVLAAMALAPVFVHPPQLPEELGRGPDFRKGRLPDIARGQVQIAARLHFPPIGDKGEPLPSETPLGHGLHAVGRRGDLLSRAAASWRQRR